MVCAMVGMVGAAAMTAHDPSAAAVFVRMTVFMVVRCVRAC